MSYELAEFDLGKKKKKGIFGRIFGLFKKSITVMDPVMKRVLNKKKGKKKKFLLFGEDDALGDFFLGDELADEAKDPKTAFAMAAMVTSAKALTDAGVKLPPEMQAMVDSARTALQSTPGGEQRISEANKVLQSVGIVSDPMKMDWKLWAGIGVGTLALVGLTAYVVSPGTKSRRR
jgi:hypothetical protein